MDERNSPKNRPQWTIDPRLQLAKNLRQQHGYYLLSVIGIDRIIQRSDFLEATTERIKELSDSDYSEPEESTQRREAAKKEADLAREEKRRGYPILHQHSTVALWGALEAFVQNFLVSWFTNRPETLHLHKIRRIKIRLGDYERLSAEERCEFLIGELERDLGAPLKQGANRFEALFDVIGLSGEIEGSVQKDLLELSQVRNVIVHRQGVVDRKFVETCRWVGLKPGDELLVTQGSYERYVDAVISYALLLDARVKRYFGPEEGPRFAAPEEDNVHAQGSGEAHRVDLSTA